MSSLGGTIIALNMGSLRALIGLMVNKFTVNLSRDSIEDYYKLAFIEIIGTFIPLTYMYRMIPSNAEIKKT